MEEIVPGVLHYAVLHERIKQIVHSYVLPDAATVIDPMIPPEGLEWFEQNGAPERILLTNRHHYRHTGEFVERFGCPVHASREGMHEFRRGEPVEPFAVGDVFPGGIEVHEVGAICPDEVALYYPPARALACADGVVRWESPDAPLAFVPDYLLSDDPEADKRGLRESYRRLIQTVDFDALLLAHGNPIPRGGKEALREFIERV
jgi:glyoxylase-like metal-dependent hydrolase (beta-lactamase superfamily II)